MLRQNSIQLVQVSVLVVANEDIRKLLPRMALNNYKTVFRADYKPNLNYYSRMFDTAAQLTGYKDWVTTGLAITLQDFDERTSFTLAHNFLAYVRDVCPREDLGDDAKRVAEIVEKVPKQLDIGKFQRLGFRCWFLYPVEMNFEQLVFVVADKFLLQNKEIKEGICPAPTDAAYAVHFTEGSLKVVLRVGPMKREEVDVQFQPDRNSNFAVKERALPSEELFSNLPKASLLIDIDASQTEVQSNLLRKFLDDAQALQVKLSKNIVQYVFGLRAKGK